MNLQEHTVAVAILRNYPQIHERNEEHHEIYQNNWHGSVWDLRSTRPAILICGIISMVFSLF